MYFGPSAMFDEKDRATPYATSAAVIGVPSRYFRPDFSVYLRVLPSWSASVPVLVARSPTSIDPCVVGSTLHAVSCRVTSWSIACPSEM